MFSVHRKQTPYAVVGSLGGMRGSRIFCRGGGEGVQARLPENSSDNFFSPQHYRGCPMVFSNITIIFNIFRGVQMLISLETHITYDFPGGVQTRYPPLDPRMGRLCVCTCPSSEPSLLANATSTRIRLVSRDACNEQMINCNCTHQSSGYLLHSVPYARVRNEVE